MGRRDPTLQRLLLWHQLPRPCGWEQVFGRRAPLRVEIGCGGGEYLARTAQEEPGKDFLGVESHWPSVRRTLRRLHNARISNARCLLGDATVVLQRLMRRRSLHEVESLFPCPWPKERHARHRLFSRSFLRLLNSRLEEDALLRVVTDHGPFRDWVLKEAASSGFHRQVREIGPTLGTRYESKWRAGGQDVFYELVFRKQVHQEVPQEEDRPVHAHRIPRFDPGRFSPADHGGEIHVAFKEFLYDPHRQHGMVRVVINEDPLLQNLWIAIRKEGDWWRILPARGTAMVPTTGLQKALDLVRDAAGDPGTPGGP